METSAIPIRPPEYETGQPEFQLLSDGSGHVEDQSVCDRRAEELTAADRVRNWLGRVSMAGREAIGRVKEGYDNVNARIGLGYASLTDRAGDGNTMADKTDLRPGFGKYKLILLGAMATHLVMSRTQGYGIFDGSEDAVQTVAFITPIDEVPVIPDGPDNDIDGDGVSNWQEFRNNIRASFDYLSGLFVADEGQGAIPESTVDDPTFAPPLLPQPPEIQPVPIPLPDVLEPPPPANEVPVPSPVPAPSPPAVPAPDAAPPATGVYNYNAQPQPDEYMWDYMERVGVPDDVIMRELDEAADHLSATTDSQVEWHGSGRKRWLEIDGKSDTTSLWRILQSHLKQVA